MSTWAFPRFCLSYFISFKSLRLEAGGLDHLRPLLAFGAHDGREGLRCTTDRVETEALEFLPQLRQRHGLVDLLVEQRDDLLWCSRRHQRADPAVAVHVREAGFGNGRHLRQRRRHLLTEDGQDAQLAVPLLWRRRRRRRKADRRMIRNRGCDGWAA